MQPGRSAKFHRDWQGPFIIQEVLNDTTCKIRQTHHPPNTAFTVHFNRLKPATQIFSTPVLPPPILFDNVPPSSIEVEIPASGSDSACPTNYVPSSNSRSTLSCPVPSSVHTLTRPFDNLDISDPQSDQAPGTVDRASSEGGYCNERGL
ncbi:MAG: hypothetical protein ACRDDF_01075 [Aeromonas sp.]